MTDPHNALVSFQSAFLLGEISLHRCTLDRNLYLLADKADGEHRFTYVRLHGRTVTAFANFVRADPLEGKPCIHVGYAVPEAYRNQGRAKDVIAAAIAELRFGFREVMPLFYVEAIVGADNIASQRVAAKVISDKPTAVTDKISNLPAFQYLRRISSD